MAKLRAMDEGAPLDLWSFWQASRYGRFLEALLQLPREHWGVQGTDGHTLLHYACCGLNETSVPAILALLSSGHVDVNARAVKGATALFYAVTGSPPRAVEILCAAGADMQPLNVYGESPLEYVLRYGSDYFDQARALLANGVRLRTVREKYRDRITPKLVAFERGILRCRTAVVAMLRVKRAGQLWRWDKFLLREVAYAVWATRYDTNWQN